MGRDGGDCIHEERGVLGGRQGYSITTTTTTTTLSSIRDHQPPPRNGGQEQRRRKEGKRRRGTRGRGETIIVHLAGFMEE